MTSPSHGLSPRGGVRWVRGRLLHGLAPLTVGLAVTAAVMAGACTLQARDASRSSTAAAKEMALSQAYQDIESAANREYSAQLRYLSTDHRSSSDGPDAGAEVGRIQIARFAQAQSDLRAAVERVNSLGSVDDKSLATFVRVEDRQYSQNARIVFAAVESGQIAEAQHLATTITGPRVDALISLVASAAATHERRSKESMTRLTERSRLAAIAIPASFTVALLLLGGCWVILLQLNKAVRYQASALLAEKQLLSTVIESSPYFVYWKDAAGLFLGANRAFERLRSTSAPIRSAGEMRDAAWQELVTDAGNPDLIRRLIELEQQVQEAGVAALDQQATVQSPDGEERRLLFSVLPRQGPRGPEGVIGVGVDVTLMTDLERQLATASRLESIGQLAAGMAHEINTPIQYISDNTRFVQQSLTDVLEGLRRMSELARQPDVTSEALRIVLAPLDLDFLTEELPSALNESQDGLQRVAELVRAMKEFSHPGTGVTDTNVNRALQNAVQVSRSEWKEVADVEFQLDEEVGLIPCYEGELKQTFLNIVVNAAQAIGEDRRRQSRAALGRIVVSTARRNDGVVISIRDDGPGMGEEVRRRVFDSFFTTKGVGQGTGQGLALAHATVVKKHGGTIDVESTPGAGTVFTITLPDKQQLKATPESLAATSPPAPATPQ